MMLLCEVMCIMWISMAVLVLTPYAVTLLNVATVAGVVWAGVDAVTGCSWRSGH